MSITKRLFTLMLTAIMTCMMATIGFADNKEVGEDIKGFYYTNKGFIDNNVHTVIPEFRNSNCGYSSDEGAGIAACKNAVSLLYPVVAGPDKVKNAKDIDELFSKLNRKEPLEAAYGVLSATNTTVATTISNGEYTGASKNIFGLDVQIFDSKEYEVEVTYKMGVATGAYISMLQTFENKKLTATYKKAYKTLNYNMSANRQLKLSDCMLPGYEAALEAELNAIEKNNGSKHTLLVGAIKINGNEEFYFDKSKKKDRKLVVIYNAGEIAVASDGPIVYEIPLEKIKKYVNTKVVK